MVDTQPACIAFKSNSPEVSVTTRGKIGASALSFITVRQRCWFAACFVAIRDSIASFHVRFVMDMLCEEDAVLLPLFVQGLRLLEDDALGGGGSRGSGRVRFANMTLTWRGKDYYAAGAAEREIAAGADLAALQTKVQETGDSLIAE